ncbi:enoyl-CoA hydratase/isomerase family protein [Streptomyces sp. NPDC049954]|uniref:enoyl-CoA hydratase/isomerase family protein n=1 Tax=Streptomyces sp. NPDC049954 TaxID=3155779 RepID=UPI003438A230
MTAKRPAFPHIGWDPTPGDPDDTRELAKKLGGLASELGTSLQELGRIECGAWKGQTALAFVQYIGHDVTPLVRKSHDSFAKASRALHRWANQLAEFQDEADRLERTAGEKLAAREKAQQQAEDPDKGDDETKNGKALAKASGAVDEVTQKVDDLQDRYERAAAAAGKELDKAGDLAPNEPGFWHKLAKGVAEAWDATGQWIEDHAELVKQIGDLLSDLTGMLGLLAIMSLPFPPLAAIFGTAALIASGLALAAHSLAKAHGADVSWVSIGFDAVGLVPGFGGIGKGIKMADEAKALSTASKLGKNFVVRDPAEARKLFSKGLQAAESTGGLRLLSGKVVVYGKANLYSVEHAGSGLLSRMGGVANAGYHGGQLMGTKGMRLIAPKVNPHGVASRIGALDPFSDQAMLVDGAVKIAPKLLSYPRHMWEALSSEESAEEDGPGR